MTFRLAGATCGAAALLAALVCSAASAAPRKARSAESPGITTATAARAAATRSTTAQASAPLATAPSVPTPPDLAKAPPSAPGPAAPPAPEVAASGVPPRLDGLAQLLNIPTVLRLTAPTSGAAGEAVGPTAALGILDAVRTARGFSPEARAAGYRAEAAAQARRGALGALLPKADVRAAGGAGELTSVTPTTRLQRQEGVVTVRQSLVDEFNRQETRRQGLLSDSSRLQHEAAGGQAMLDAAATWLQVAQTAVALQLGADYERRLGELLRYVTERTAAGGASVAERDRVRARTANIRTTLAESRAVLTAAVRQLERMTGEPVSALALVGARAPMVPADADRAYEEALRSNSELRSLQLERQAATADQRVQRARFMPKLELELTHSRNRNAGGQLGELKDTKAMIVLNMSLYNGGSDLAQVRAAAARLGEMDARMDGTGLRLRQELQASYANLDAAQAKFASVREELANNQRVVDAFQAQLVAGTRPLLDVLDAYQRLHQSRLDLAQVLVSIAQNEWRVGYLLGQLPAVLDPAPAGN